MKKRLVIFSLLTLILVLSIFLINAEGGTHAGSIVKINIGGKIKTLDSVSGEDLKGTAEYYYSGVNYMDNPGHNAAQIWVKVGNKQNTLLNALKSGPNGLCPGKSLVSSSSNRPAVYHLASEIDLDSGKTLQKAIDDGDFCCASNFGNSCYPSGVDESCTNPGTYNCDGECVGYSFKSAPADTPYGEGAVECGDKKLCDGQGNCVDCKSYICDGTICGTYLLGDFKRVCGDSITCVECPSGYSCRDGRCCLKTSSTKCYQGDVWWYDSCGYRSYKKEECGTSFCLTYNEGCASGSSIQYKKVCYGQCIDDSRCADVTTFYTENCPSGQVCSGGSCVVPEEDDGGKVICTELYNLGDMDEETYEMDLEYAAVHFSPEAIRGYQAWAIPVVKAMRQSKEDKELVSPMVENFLEEVAYRMGKSETGNEAGRILLDEGVPLFERIGVLINEPDWKSLFNKNWLNLVFPLKNLFEEILKNTQKTEYDKLVENYFTIEKVREMGYNARNRSSSDIEFANALIEELEKAVEEIERLDSGIDN